MRMMLVGLVLCVLCGLASAGEWTASVGSDYETFQAAFIYSPDEYSGVGAMVTTDSYVSDDTDEKVAVGPCVQFLVSDVTGAAIDRVIPGDWSMADAPLKTYGVLAFLFETAGDNNLLFQVGTKTILFPEWRVRPCITSVYSKGEGGSDFDEDWKTLLGFDYRI